jgi:hypothetical protein
MLAANLKSVFVKTSKRLSKRQNIVPRAGTYQVRSSCRYAKSYAPRYPSPGGVAQLVERVLYHSTRRAVPERSWVQSLLPTTEVEPGFSTFGGMLVPVLQLISPVCKTGTSLMHHATGFGIN